jgi:hypothetical protein
VKNYLKTGSTNGLSKGLCSTAWETKEKDILLLGIYLDDFSIPIPEQVQSNALIQEIDSNKKYDYFLSVVKIYNGNSGQVYKTSEANFFTILHLKIVLNRLLFLTYRKSKSLRLDAENRNGGKIIEKANAKSNVLDNEIRSLSYYKEIGNNSLGINKMMQNNLRTRQLGNAHILNKLMFNMLNSRWLNEVNKLTVNTQHRTIVTDVKHRQPGIENPFPKE